MMFPGLGNGDAARDLAAISASQAIARIDLDGIVLDANANFCSMFDYEPAEIIGRHHGMLIAPDHARSDDYQELWAGLKAGKPIRRQHECIGRYGRPIWLEASYNPVFSHGKPVRIIAIASDVTEARRRAAEDASRLEAISRALGVIEFTPAGTILTANGNVCAILGYKPNEIAGRHHAIFCDRIYVQAEEYHAFWRQLGEGEALSGEFLHYGKNRRPIWLQASYHPILDEAGRVVKIVQFATDITEHMTSLDRLGGAIAEMARGNLTARLEGAVAPDMEKARMNLNVGIERLRLTVKNAFDDAESLSGRARRIRDGSGMIIKRAKQQAASIEDIATRVNEARTTAKASADQAIEVCRLAATARRAVEKSDAVIENAVSAMGRIEQSSRQIGAIIDMIDEIASQSHRLALKAGIEVARAGDTNGFSVVAQEVHELAQRSAKAAWEIKGLIAASSAEVDAGVRLVGQADTALSDVAAHVAGIDANITALIETSHQQASGLRRIGEAMGGIGKIARQNAATAEESKAAGDALAGEVNHLIEMFRQFSFDSGHGHRPHRPGTPHLRLVNS